MLPSSSACPARPDEGGRRSVRNDTALEGAPELRPPPQKDPVLRSDIAGGEFDPQATNVSEVLEDLCRGAVGYLWQEAFATAMRVVEVADGSQDAEEHELEEVGEALPWSGEREG
ncbi:hypothetical protein C4D60_Mb06t32810 [Musa balbisiana]|uniref:Uncharacterized protein n=1 Tax=Musa balbisiana TaxID=52838 RepID=A0A4S8ISC4_MUSBA|nr:hypothetical protein C4D60_Mb06t32810 [Musa balbisiana]